MNMRFAKFDADIAKNDPTVAKLRSRIFDYVFGKTQFGIKKIIGDRTLTSPLGDVERQYHTRKTRKHRQHLSILLAGLCFFVFISPFCDVLWTLFQKSFPI